MPDIEDRLVELAVSQVGGDEGHVYVQKWWAE